MASTGEADWVSRSDLEPPQIIDVVPVAAESRRMRRVSSLEQAVALISRPFGIAFVLAIAAFGGGRRHLMALMVAGALLASACRGQVIWSGAEFQEDGTLKLASEQPLCGCLTVANISGNELQLRSTIGETTVGRITLKPDEQSVFRFDWAGPEDVDVYELVGSGTDNSPVDLRPALRIVERSRWLECASIPCENGDLSMNLGQSRR